MTSAGITMKDIAFSLQKAVTNAAIKDTPMISVPVPTALPLRYIFFLDPSSVVGMYCANISHYVHDPKERDEHT